MVRESKLILSTIHVSLTGNYFFSLLQWNAADQVIGAQIAPEDRKAILLVIYPDAPSLAEVPDHDGNEQVSDRENPAK